MIPIRSLHFLAAQRCGSGDITMDKSKHIAMFLSTLRGGGAERVFLDLAGAFGKRGYRVDLVLSRLRGELVSAVPDSVQVIELGTSSFIKVIWTLLRLSFSTWRIVLPAMIWKKRKKVRSLPNLERYLRVQHPPVLLASTNMPNMISLWAAWLAQTETRIFIKQDNSLTNMVREATDRLQRKLPQLVRLWYRRADGIVAVSAGLAEELSQVADVTRAEINVIYNPVQIDQIARVAAQEIDDEWFRAGQPPVLLAAGRLHRQKDYPTLLRAFARLRNSHDARLVILGEGPERIRLEALIRELGVGDHVRLPGFQTNPFAYMSRSSVFVLSSAWEGLSDVLIEALACGCRIVSTDCPHGPAEILNGGKYGMLVPVRDPEALAKAIRITLDAGTDPDGARNRAREFDIDRIAQQYLDFLFDDLARQ